MKLLIKAFSEKRVIEPRLSGGFEWARYEGSGAKPSGEDFEDARKMIGRLALGDETPEALHVYGRLLTIEGKLNEAAARLRKVVSAQPRNAQAINDLGVCLFEQGKIEDALEQFDAALAIAPESREATFNRALCYRQMELRNAAISEFRRLEGIEKDPAWLGEIRSNIEAASRDPAVRKPIDRVIPDFFEEIQRGDSERIRAIVDRYTDELSSHALLDLTIEHLTHAASGDLEKSRAALSKMESIGRAFLEVKQDCYIADAVDYLKRLPASEAAKELELIKEYREAVNMTSSLEAGMRRTGYERLARLSPIFRERGHTVRQERVDIRVANYDSASNRLEKCVKRLEELFPVVKRREWPLEEADVLLTFANAYARLGQEGLALKYLGQAKAILKNARMEAKLAKALQYESNAYVRLGDLDSALSDYRESLRLMLRSFGRLEDIAFIHSEVSKIYRLRGYHSLALLHAEQALSTYESMDDRNRMAQLLAVMAVEQAELNRFDEARESIDRAIRLIADLEPEKRVYTEPLTLIYAAAVKARQGDYQGAAKHYSRSISLASRAEDNKLLMIHALRGRAEAFARSGEIEQAKTDTERLIKRLENYRAAISELKHRSTFLDSSQDAYDLIISLNISAFDNPDEAVNTSELARARALLDQIQAQGRTAADSAHAEMASLGGTTRPLKLSEIRAGLPDDLKVVEFAVTERETYVFLITRSGVIVERSQATARSLDRLVREFLSQIASKDEAGIPELKAKGRELYSYLIKPIERHLKRGDSICMVPDKLLHFLPFVALVDESGEYINSAYRISSAPSASVLIHCLRVAMAKSGVEEERIVSVGNPAFSSGRFPDLPPLPSSEDEALQVASFYTRREVLNGPYATESRVIEEMRKSSVAHLATHCLVEERSPWLAALVLASDSSASAEGVTASGDDGALVLQEVYGMNLPFMKLVVLSACRTGLGQYYRGEGIVSLVRPFIAARVPTVVASLWPVETTATARLMIDFHRFRTMNKSTSVDALRRAQLELASTDQFEHPYYWAPFVVIGSHY
ncbi:MAG TPA: CHAT domain-containing protein [Blastocatellia bacterium]|nr:CHAT domain-containing protein [Blastocatellia bacterium]